MREKHFEPGFWHCGKFIILEIGDATRCRLGNTRKNVSIGQKRGKKNFAEEREGKTYRSRGPQ